MPPPVCSASRQGGIVRAPFPWPCKEAEGNSRGMLGKARPVWEFRKKSLRAVSPSHCCVTGDPSKAFPTTGAPSNPVVGRSARCEPSLLLETAAAGATASRKHCRSELGAQVSDYVKDSVTAERLCLRTSTKFCLQLPAQQKSRRHSELIANATFSMVNVLEDLRYVQTARGGGNTSSIVLGAPCLCLCSGYLIFRLCLFV